MTQFNLQAPFQPTGDQPQAIAQLTSTYNPVIAYQTLLGATGTAKLTPPPVLLRKLANLP
jgi:excinuclease ABC subunit B